jgi:hypothetical protein
MALSRLFQWLFHYEWLETNKKRSMFHALRDPTFHKLNLKVRMTVKKSDSREAVYMTRRGGYW